MIKRLTSVFLAILLMLTTATVAETVTPEVVETWYGNVFGRVLTLTLMSVGSCEQCGDWHAYGTWEKDADGNLTLLHSDTPMTLQKTDAGLLATLNGTDTVQFLMTREPDAASLAADIRHDATLDDLQGEWEARACFVQSLCLPAGSMDGATRRLTISGTELTYYETPIQEYLQGGTIPLTFENGVLHTESGVNGEAMWFALLEDGRLLYTDRVMMTNGDYRSELYVSIVMAHPEGAETPAEAALEEAETPEVTETSEKVTNPRNDESWMGYTKVPETVEAWYGTAFGRQITLTLRDNGEYEESTDWHGYGTWEKDADGNLRLSHSSTPMTLQKTDAGLLATLCGTETVQFLMTREPDANALAADVRHDATLDDLQGDWESCVNFVQSLCLCAAPVNSTTRRLTISGTELRNLTAPGNQYNPEDTMPLTFADGVLSGAYEGNPMEFALLEDGRLLFLEVITLGEGEDTEELYVYYIMKHPEN